jgi:hypothetical protein
MFIFKLIEAYLNAVTIVNSATVAQIKLTNLKPPTSNVVQFPGRK